MIYFLRAEQIGPCCEKGWIKIGTTIRLSVRIKQIAAEIGHTPTILGVLDGGYSEERALHMRFAMVRCLGEWFAPCPALRELVANETRPWDGSDESPAMVSVKLPENLIFSAKIVASYRNESITSILSDILDPILATMEEEEVAKRAKRLKSESTEAEYTEEYADQQPVA